MVIKNAVDNTAMHDIDRAKELEIDMLRLAVSKIQLAIDLMHNHNHAAAHEFLVSSLQALAELDSQRDENQD